jgi:hypothetical protein
MYDRFFDDNKLKRTKVPVKNIYKTFEDFVLDFHGIERDEKEQKRLSDDVVPDRSREQKE